MNPNKEFTYPDGSIHLHRTDGKGEWLIKPFGNEIVVTENMLREMWQFVEAPLLFALPLGQESPRSRNFGEPDLAQAWGRWLLSLEQAGKLAIHPSKNSDEQRCHKVLC
ncbi:MAG: hypothetical protein CM15mP49_10540 [Actinomycetota bacterium]|nr:MAG: hypothetical protein CM15mP49_10540 [Actinomycetota bacterium]